MTFMKAKQRTLLGLALFFFFLYFFNPKRNFGPAIIFFSAALVGPTVSIVFRAGIPPGSTLEASAFTDARFTYSPRFSTPFPSPNSVGTFTGGPPGLTSGIIILFVGTAFRPIRTHESVTLEGLFKG
ncbi:hypothetical protein LX36DRAFT_379868 [Colletotrichum falcatum]|nr:hypothetical protein LX36DRAFT_379868 [Colletotrichum falcatum]